MEIINCYPPMGDPEYGLSHLSPPYVGQIFNTEDEANKFYFGYAKSAGFIIQDRTNKNMKIMGQISREFACSKPGCQAKMNIAVDLYINKYRVNLFIKSHNHSLQFPSGAAETHSEIKAPVYEFMRQNEALVRNVGNPGWCGGKPVMILSWEPRVFLYRNFLSKEGCNYLIRLADPNMTRSLTNNILNLDQPIVSSARTSFGASLRRGQDKIIAKIEEKIANFTCVPIEHGEPLHVLRYEVGQKFEPHYDYSHAGLGRSRGGQRIATFLMYLSDVEKGGETTFPLANIAIRPRMGDALLFWSLKPDGTLDPSTLHGGSPVIEGTKWSCTKWMHVGRM